MRGARANLVPHDSSGVTWSVGSGTLIGRQSRTATTKSTGAYTRGRDKSLAKWRRSTIQERTLFSSEHSEWVTLIPSPTCCIVVRFVGAKAERTRLTTTTSNSHRQYEFNHRPRNNFASFFKRVWSSKDFFLILFLTFLFIFFFSISEQHHEALF